MSIKFKKRFQGKTSTVSKDGHLGIVGDTTKPINKSGFPGIGNHAMGNFGETVDLSESQSFDHRPRDYNFGVSQDFSTRSIANSLNGLQSNSQYYGGSDASSDIYDISRYNYKPKRQFHSDVSTPREYMGARNFSPTTLASPRFSNGLPMAANGSGNGIDMRSSWDQVHMREYGSRQSDITNSPGSTYASLSADRKRQLQRIGMDSFRPIQGFDPNQDQYNTSQIAGGGNSGRVRDSVRRGGRQGQLQHIQSEPHLMGGTQKRNSGRLMAVAQNLNGKSMIAGNGHSPLMRSMPRKGSDGGVPVTYLESSGMSHTSVKSQDTHKRAPLKNLNILRDKKTFLRNFDPTGSTGKESKAVSVGAGSNRVARNRLQNTKEINDLEKYRVMHEVHRRGHRGFQ